MSASDHLNPRQHQTFKRGDSTPWGTIGSESWWGPKDSPEGRAHDKAMFQNWEERDAFEADRLDKYNRTTYPEQYPSEEYETEPGDYYEHQTSWDNKD
jgi:hypothetical protein